MSGLDISALKEGDAVGWTSPRSGWGSDIAVKRTAVARLTKTQIVTADGERFHRGGRWAGYAVGASQRYHASQLVSLDSPEAIASLVYSEFWRVHSALDEMRKAKTPKTFARLREHLVTLERIVCEAKLRAYREDDK